jgi:hypothetical protein
MMVIFFQAARLAMVAFDPYLSSRPLAETLLRSPEGQLISNVQYYGVSSVIFYTNRDALILNGRRNNLEYGSYAPGSPDVFIGDSQFARLWMQSERYYLITSEPAFPRFEKLVGTERLVVVDRSGGKILMTNQPLTAASGSRAAPRHTSSPLLLDAVMLGPLRSMRIRRAL